MGILKKFFKNPPLPLYNVVNPITKLEAGFAHCFTTLLRWGRGGGKKIVQIVVFPIIFVTDCLKKSKKFQVWYFTVDCFESL